MAGVALRACAICSQGRLWGRPNTRGLEVREVQGEARMAAVQLLRLAERLLVEGVRRALEADTVGAQLGEEAELGRPEAQCSSCLGH